jgi:outer membrane protein
MRKTILIIAFVQIVFAASMTLDDCIKTAEKNNLGVQISGSDREISRHSLIDAKNRFFDITGKGSYSFYADDDENKNTTLSGSAGVEGRLSPLLLHNYKYSKLSDKNSEITYESVMNEIRYTIINSFFQVLISSEKLKLQRDISEYSQKKFDEAQLKYSMGNISKSDLLSFEVSKSSDVIDLKAAESGLKKSKQNLIHYMNAELNPDSLDLFYEPATITSETFSEAELFDEALKNNPDVSVQRNYLSMQELSLKMEYDDYLPSLTGSLGYEYSKYDDMNNDMMSRTSDGIVGRLGLSMNITYSGLNGIDKGKVSVKKSRLQLDNKTESVKNEIRLKLLELENQKNNLELAGKHVELAKENLDLADKLFFIGDKSATDYLQARNDFIKAEYNKINAQYNYILSRYDLFNSLGRKP